MIVWFRAIINASFTKLTIIAILMLAFGLRVYQLDDQSVWFDEAARLIIARADLARILKDTGGDTLPPFYHLTLHFWQYLGSSDFWLRLPSVFASTLTVAVIYILSIELLNVKTAFLAALIMAIMPYQVFHAQQANLYSFLLLFGALQILFFWLAINNNRLIWWLGYGLSTIIGMYIHYFAVLVILTLHLWLLIKSIYLRGKAHQNIWRTLIVSNLVLILFLLPLTYYLVQGSEAVSSNFWLTKPSLVAPLSTIHLFTVSYSIPPSIVPIIFGLTIGLFALVSFELTYEYKRNREVRPVLLLLVLLAFFPMILVLGISQIVPIYLDRTLIISTPAYCIFLARGLAATRWKSPVRYFGILVGTVFFVSLIGYYFVGEFAKPNYRQTAELVSNQIKPEDAIVHTSNGSYIPFLLYRGPKKHFLLEGDPSPHHPPRVHEVAGGTMITLEELSSYDNVWLVVAFDHSIGYQETLLGNFDKKYPLLEDYSVNGIVVRHYDLSPDRIHVKKLVDEK